MQARVDSGITFERKDLPEKAIAILRKALSFPNPEYAERIRLGLSLRFCPETLCYLEEQGHMVRLPRGASEELKRVVRDFGLEVKFTDERKLRGPLLNPTDVGLRDYQERAVDRFCKARQGYVVLPCGGGKTRCGMGAMARIKEPTLVLVMSLDLAEQWRVELAEKLGVEATVVGGGEENVSDVTIAVAQALVRWDQAKLDTFLARFGMLVCDEAHHCPCDTLAKIVDRCPAKFRLGLTATPEREDGLTQLLDLYLGEKLVEVKHDELVAAGHLIVPEVRILETSYRFDYQSQEDYPRMLEDLAFNVARNDLIVNAIEREAKEGNVCLALSGRIDHCEHLQTLLTERGVRAECLTSSVKKKVRKELLEQAKRGDLLVLLATSLADEGLDLPRLSRVFLVFPGKSKGRTIQRVGRLMRPHPDKSESILFDFADRKIPILRRHHLERRRLYAEVLGIPASKLRSTVDNGASA